MTTLLLVFASVASLAAAAFFAGTETCLLSVSRERILHLSREGGRKARIVQAALSDMGRTTTMLLIGNNLASVAYSASTAALSVQFGFGSITRVVWNLATAFAVLYFSEFTPKLVCAARPLRYCLLIADAFRAVEIALKPLTWIAMKATDAFVPRHESRYKLTLDELVRILQDRKDGVCVSDVESALISRIIVLRVKGRAVTSGALMDALRSEVTSV